MEILKCLACGWQLKLEGAAGSLCRVNWSLWSHLPVVLGSIRHFLCCLTLKPTGAGRWF